MWYFTLKIELRTRNLFFFLMHSHKEVGCCTSFLLHSCKCMPNTRAHDTICGLLLCEAARRRVKQNHVQTIASPETRTLTVWANARQPHHTTSHHIIITTFVTPELICFWISFCRVTSPTSLPPSPLSATLCPPLSLSLTAFVAPPISDSVDCCRSIFPQNQYHVVALHVFPYTSRRSTQHVPLCTEFRSE